METNNDKNMKTIEDVLNAFRMRFPADVKGNLILGFPCDALDENKYKIIIEAAEKPYTILEEILSNVCGNDISFTFVRIVGKTDEEIEKINNLANLL